MKELYSLSAEELETRLLGAVGDNTWPPIHKAVELAKDKHTGQLRKDGSEFVTHPFRVALLLLEVGNLNDPNLLCAAVLHDIVEDTELNCDDLMGDFGSKVADLVRSMTLPDLRDGQSKSDRDQVHFSALSWDGRDSQILRSSDRLDNILSLNDDFPPDRLTDYLADTRKGLLPLTLACNTAIYHALNDSLAASGCPE
ncbi:MAG TPA: HD domain-containing protein [Planctomycetota bacterium]|jgi:(p)ppGpp synthase/HD superfamily hydrolase|nr:hypothetical protein [Planctomycetota bacterium]MDP6128808.1 HD domain-containing protein [Planctomycetota bacterium]MDP7245032.1 HD domain-containing protein [Planctomycetota bacterium]HJM39775.1 HD domain-containing protein [Planctomycetota bacterium]|tara:strand:- start:1207 stop:1800 length:594 start_codon:yes stop_codon:yes gene_type:complete